MANDINMLLDKYEQQFGDCFPLMLCKGMDYEHICKVVQECIDKNKPYSPDLEPDADY